jgi:hypothetical protein
MLFFHRPYKKNALLDSEVLSNGSEMYCILERDAMHSSRYGPREFNRVNRLCRTAVLEEVGLTSVCRITSFDRSNFFLVFERSQCMKQIKIKFKKYFIFQEGEENILSSSFCSFRYFFRIHSHSFLFLFRVCLTAYNE